MNAAIEKAKRHGWIACYEFDGRCLLWHRSTRYGVRIVRENGKVIVERI